MSPALQLLQVTRPLVSPNCTCSSSRAPARAAASCSCHLPPRSRALHRQELHCRSLTKFIAVCYVAFAHGELGDSGSDIGPYHHGQDHLKPAEKAKHVAAYHCIRESGHSVQEMYDAVASLDQYARGLYDKDVVAGIGDDDFLPMMFYDACFLVLHAHLHKFGRGYGPVAAYLLRLQRR